MVVFNYHCNHVTMIFIFKHPFLAVIECFIAKLELLFFLHSNEAHNQFSKSLCDLCVFPNNGTVKFSVKALRS